MKVMLISGGSRGIGAELVRYFSKQGYVVVFSYFKSEKIALELAKETGATCYFVDVSNSESVDNWIKQVLATYRHIDNVVHCAGISNQALFHTLTDLQWHEMINTNLSSAFYICRKVLPSMIERKQGNILFISSIWGQVGASMEVHYSTAKAGLIGMTKALAKEVAPSKIRVNCICPGVIQTDMLNIYSLEDKLQLAQETPLGRIGVVSDIPPAVSFFLQEQSSFITGQVLSVDGGFAL